MGAWKTKIAIKTIPRRIGWLVILCVAQFVWAQAPGVKVGENTHLNAGGLLTMGYSGDYGDDIGSSHGLNFGGSGSLTGYYYNPNFLNFTATPYYNQSRNDSSFQSLTDATGITGTANFFTGSNFPGSVSYHYDRNTTGTFGFVGQPDFTTVGTGQGFGITWSALVPNLPTLSVSYTQGSGSGTVYGTNQETSSGTRTLNFRSTYQLEGFRLNGYFDHLHFNSAFPQFLSGDQLATSNSNGHDFGFGASHDLPMHGSFYGNYNRSAFTADNGTSQTDSVTTKYTISTENAGVTLHPTERLGVYANETFTGNLSGALIQSLLSAGATAPTVNLGTTSHSVSVSGGANYRFTDYLFGSAQATHFEQFYYGTNYSGTFVSGTVNYGRRLLNMFTFSASVVDSSSALDNNAFGFVGSVNYSRRYGRWNTAGSFSYAQNVQTLLLTYTTSYFNYNGNAQRRVWRGLQWTAGFNGSHSGLSQQPGSVNHSEGYSTSLSTGRFSVNTFYNSFSGIGVLSNNGLVPVSPTPGLLENGLIVYNGDSYGGGFSVTPVSRLVISGSYSRALSNTFSTSSSRNNTQIYNTQLQYHLRRIDMRAGYTRFSQGISAAGIPPGSINSYFVGVSRWFDLF